MHKKLIAASAFLFSMALSTGAFAQGGYGATPDQTEPGIATPPTQQEQVQIQPELGTQLDGGQFISSGEIIGQDIINPEGERLGQIRGLMMDMEAERIGYVVVSAGGLFGIGRREHLVPWNAVQLDPQQGTYLLNITADQLREAPTGREITSREEAMQLHEFYGVAPYWEESTLQMRRERMHSPRDRPASP